MPESNTTTKPIAAGLGLVHARYVIAVGDYGVTIYSEDACGQWDATGLNPNGPFATVIEAAEHLRTLPNPQNQVEVVSRVSVALMLGAQPDQPARWWSTTREALRPELRHVDAGAPPSEEALNDL